MATQLTKVVKRQTQEKYAREGEAKLKILGIRPDGSINSVPLEGRALVIELIPGKLSRIALRYHGTKESYSITVIDLLNRLRTEGYQDVMEDLGKKKMGMTKRTRKRS